MRTDLAGEVGLTENWTCKIQTRFLPSINVFWDFFLISISPHGNLVHVWILICWELFGLLLKKHFQQIYKIPII